MYLSTTNYELSFFKRRGLLRKYHSKLSNSVHLLIRSIVYAKLVGELHKVYFLNSIILLTTVMYYTYTNVKIQQYLEKKSIKAWEKRNRVKRKKKY